MVKKTNYINYRTLSKIDKNVYKNKILEALPKTKRYNPYKHWAVAFSLSTRTQYIFSDFPSSL